MKQNMFQHVVNPLSLFIETWSNCLPSNLVVLATPITEETADQGSADHSVWSEIWGLAVWARLNPGSLFEGHLIATMMSSFCLEVRNLLWAQDTQVKN